jgi:antitoxin VapB
MALNIRSPETEALATELARLTGETKTEAVTKAVRDRLERVKRGRHRRSLADELDAIGKQCAALPVLDPRDPDEIVGYDEHGIAR